MLSDSLSSFQSWMLAILDEPASPERTAILTQYLESFQVRAKELERIVAILSETDTPISVDPADFDGTNITRLPIAPRPQAFRHYRIVSDEASS